MSRRLAVAAWITFFALLVLLPVLRTLTSSQPLAVFDSFYRAGALVFGGGYVVLPLLQAEVVPPGWVSIEEASRTGEEGLEYLFGLVDAEGRTVRFADHHLLEDAGVVVWATGYRADYGWIRIPGVVREGHVVHRRGVTEVPGLCFLGLSWQHTRGSALLGFVHDDAAYLADRIAARHQAAGSATIPATQEPST